MSMAARARRLVAARRIGQPVATGLVWVTAAQDLVVADPTAGRVVHDYTVLVFRSGDVSEAVWRERLARSEGDHGDVLAWDGSLVGSVRPGGSGSLLLVFGWPAGLAAVEPGSERAVQLAAAEASGLDDLERLRASRSAEDARVAAELADVERLRGG